MWGRDTETSLRLVTRSLRKGKLSLIIPASKCGRIGTPGCGNFTSRCRSQTTALEKRSTHLYKTSQTSVCNTLDPETSTAGGEKLTCNKLGATQKLLAQKAVPGTRMIRDCSNQRNSTETDQLHIVDIFSSPWKLYPKDNSNDTQLRISLLSSKVLPGERRRTKRSAELGKHLCYANHGSSKIGSTLLHKRDDEGSTKAWRNPDYDDGGVKVKDIKGSVGFNHLVESGKLIGLRWGRRYAPVENGFSTFLFQRVTSGGFYLWGWEEGASERAGEHAALWKRPKREGATRTTPAPLPPTPSLLLLHGSCCCLLILLLLLLLFCYFSVINYCVVPVIVHRYSKWSVWLFMWFWHLLFMCSGY